MANQIVGFPQYLHRPWRIFIFETDELVVAGLIYMLGMMLTVWLVWTIPVVIYLYRVQKAKRPRGFLMQLGYKFGVINLIGYPIAFIKRYSE